MKLYCKILILFFIAAFSLPAFADFEKATIVNSVNAAKNAKMHNNLGNIYFKEKDLYAAIKEYRIAIAIDPDSQATASYFNNLGKVYLVLGEIQKRNNLPIKGYDDFSKMAAKSFEEAILKDCMKLEYYENLIKAYELTGAVNSKKEYFLSNKDKNPFNIIPASIILKKQGNDDYANMLLDDFVSNNPDIVISKDLKKLMKKYY